MKKHRISCAVLAALCTAAATPGQVHYHDDGRPWRQRAKQGPDAEVDGWYYNLGPTGIRVQLVADAPEHLLVKHVFADSPASRHVEIGDYITGAGGRAFDEPHKNGYGMDVFGPDGPILAFAEALETSQGAKDRRRSARRGRLALTLLRDGERREVELRLKPDEGPFGADFPANCKRSDNSRKALLRFLLDSQRDDGSFGNPIHNTFAPLALLPTGSKEHLRAVERCVRWHMRTTKAKDDSWLINWRYMAAAIVLSEYHLATGAKWVLPELQEIHDFLAWSQYVDMQQINPKAKESHPHSYPKSAEDSHGGWGHNPGFEGYGPICMLTGQGALAFALMHRCGIEIDRARLDAAYDFLARGTGPNGYVWYGDDVGNPRGWADMGRTGAAGLANALSPYRQKRYRKAALEHARVIGEHPESFPDTHGSPVMGMAYAAAAAAVDDKSFRSLMDNNRWWFTLAQCGDGTFYYQPNRDNAGYGNDARLSASAVTAFILSIPQRNLAITGRQ